VGQVAVVTGAAQGLGRALAAGLIDRGVSVVLADIATERLQTTAEAFTARGARVLSVITDVRDAAAVTTLASRSVEYFGRVDIVVNSAGIGGGGQPLWHSDPQDWQSVLGVNLLVAVHGIQAFVPHLVRAGRCAKCTRAPAACNTSPAQYQPYVASGTTSGSGPALASSNPTHRVVVDTHPT
jgi:NADP-dependent 3-hydroxy acid dehydrogenase YdfG